MKDLTTLMLIEICKGQWDILVNLPPQAVTPEIRKWTELCKLRMLEEYKKELHNRMEKDFKIL